MTATPKYQPPESLIITPSGMRGIFGQNLFPEVILKFCEAFGTWLQAKRKGSSFSEKINSRCTVLVGMDTRTSGPLVKHLAIGALMSVGVDIIDMDVCATPLLLFGHKLYKCDGTIIISASHNPPQYNGMKCLAPSGTFLSKEELEEINQYFYEIIPKNFVPWNEQGTVTTRTDLYDKYVGSMQSFLNFSIFKEKQKNALKVIVDPGAGAGTGLTARILQILGLNVIEINSKKLGTYEFPREFEPIKPHLSKLSQTVIETQAQVGFAHDCDADRLGLIGEKGEIYPEDTILAIIVEYLLQQEAKKEPNMRKKPLIVTNCASSLVLDDLALKYKGAIIHTPIGERYLAEKMNQLLGDPAHSKDFVFGGEGSCGGVMIPLFNNTRDGIFAAVKICEILLNTGKKISELVNELPQYVSVRKKLNVKGSDALVIIKKLEVYLIQEKIPFERIDNDVKIHGEKEWTLIHPSNTEPIIRIITEAPSSRRAEELLDEMDKLIAKLS